MKKLSYLIAFAIGLLMPALIFGQDVIVPPTSDEIMSLLASLGGLKGASTLAIVAVVVQGLMLMLKSSIGKFAGAYQLLAVLLLTLAGGVVGLMIQGMDIGAALMHSSTLAAGQVLLHQIYKQFIEKKVVQA